MARRVASAVLLEDVLVAGRLTRPPGQSIGNHPRISSACNDRRNLGAMLASAWTRVLNDGIRFAVLGLALASCALSGCAAGTLSDGMGTVLRSEVPQPPPSKEISAQFSAGS